MEIMENLLHLGLIRPHRPFIDPIRDINTLPARPIRGSATRTSNTANAMVIWVNAYAL